MLDLVAELAARLVVDDDGSGGVGEDDGVDFVEKMNGLTAKLREQITQGRKLDEQILSNLEKLGFGG